MKNVLYLVVICSLALAFLSAGCSNPCGKAWARAQECLTELCAEGGAGDFYCEEGHELGEIAECNDTASGLSERALEEGATCSEVLTRYGNAFSLGGGGGE